MADEDFLREEILEIGRQESRNFRTAIIISGLLVSGLSLLAKNNFEPSNRAVTLPLLMLLIGLLMSSIILSYGVNLFRWYANGFTEVSQSELKNYLSIQKKLIALSRAALILSVLIGIYAAMAAAEIDFGLSSLLAVGLPTIATVLIICIGWRLTR